MSKSLKFFWYHPKDQEISTYGLILGYIQFNFRLANPTNHAIIRMLHRVNIGETIQRQI